MNDKGTTRFPEGTIRSLTAILPFFVIFVVGVPFAWWTMARADREMREDLLQQTQLVTREVETGAVRELSGTGADISTFAYLRMKEHFAAIRSSNPHCRFVYLLGRKPDGRVFFFLDSERAGSKDESTAGQIYDGATADLRRIFDTKASMVEGPVTDRWGVWVSGLVPVIDPKNGAVIAVLGMDIDARAWKWDIMRAGIPPFAFMLILMGILIVSGLARSRKKGWRHAEVVMTIAIGITLTLAVAWLVHTDERRHHRDAFSQFAQPQASRISEIFHSLSQVELESLARFLEGKQYVSGGEFQQFVGFLSRNPVIQAWEWIPAILEEDRDRFSQESRQTGVPDFGIWQKGGDGKKIAASGRQVYYPVLYVAPAAGNERVLGYDLGSEPVRYAAIETAERTGAVTGTDPITLVQETASQKGMLVYRPLFEGDAPRRLRGLALAVLRFGTLLETATADKDEVSAVAMELFLLRVDQPGERLASTRGAGGNGMRPPPFSVAHPIFVFGKTFSLTASPTPAFEKLYPARAGWAAALAGLALTASLAFWVGMILSRREELERLVVDRTNALRESMEKHRLLIENSHDIIYTLTSAGIFSFVSHSWSTLLGHPVTQVIGQPFQKFVHPEDIGKCEAFLRRMIETGQPRASIDYRVRHSDGSWRWHVSNAILLKDKDGIVSGIEGSASDITGRKQAEEEIKRQSSLISSLLDSIPDIVFFKDVHGVYLGCNPSFARLVGRARGEIIGKTDYDLFDRDLADFFRGHDQRMLEARQPKHNEEWITYPDGREILIDTLKTPYWGPDGSLIGILGISRDITGRKRAEEALRESAEMVQLLLNSTAEAIYGLDRNGLCTFTNTACLKVLGYERVEQLLGKNMHELIHSKYADGAPYDVARCPIFKAFQEERESHVDDEVLWRRDGTCFPAEYWSYPIRQDGKIIGAVVTFLDITERKKAEDALLESKLFLQETQRIARLSGWKANPQTDYLEWTDEAFEIIEFPKNKQPGLAEGLKFFLPEHIPELKESISRCLDFGERFAIECQGITGKGKMIWTEVRGLAPMTEEGRSYVMGTFQDITERKQTEDALRKISGRLALATRAGGVGIWDYDVVNNQLVWDEQMYRLYGITQDQFGGAYEAWQAGVHPEDRQRGDQEIQSALHGEKEFDTEFRVLWPDGTVRNIRALAVVQRDVSGKPTHMVGTNWDITAQKRAETALRESESNFRTFFESMTDMIVVGSSDGRMLFTNAAVTQTLGYSDEELAAMRVLDLHPGDKRREAEEIFAAMLRGERKSCPLPLARKDGSLVPAETRIWFGRWNGQDCIFGVSKNLTAEQEAQQRFERLFHNNPALMALSSLAERRFSDVNDALLNALGYSRGDVIGKTAEEISLFVSSDQQAIVADKLQREGRIMGFEMQVRRKDGEVLDGLFSGEVISSQGRQYLLTVMIDITERKKAENLLKFRESSLSSIIENQPGLVWLKDADGRFLVVNNAFARSCGLLRPDRLVGKTDLEVWPEELARMYRADDAKVISSGKSLMTEELILDAGEHKWFETFKTPIFDARGTVIGTTGYSRDITERRRIAEELRNANEGLERTVRERTKALMDAQFQMIRSEKLAVIGQLASSVAHELRNPLGVIKNVVYYLRMLEPVTAQPEIRENLDTISEEIESSNKIISDLLEFSRIKKPALRPENVNTIVKEAFHRLMVGPGIEVVTEYEEAPPELAVDALQIQQIICNLANNALQAMEKGGRLTVRTKTTGEFFDISFADTGSGISQENLPKIFDPLFSTKVNGTGLGLSICRSIVEGHGGTIEVASEVGRGSVFTVRLPVRAG